MIWIELIVHCAISAKFSLKKKWKCWNETGQLTIAKKAKNTASILDSKTEQNDQEKVIHMCR